MADAVHKVLVDDVADGLLLLDFVLDIGSGCNRAVALSGECVVDQLTGGLNGQGLGNTNGNHGLTGETLSLDILVGCDDDGLGTSDLTLGELVLNTDLAMGLDLNGQTALGSCLLQRLLSDEGVRNAGVGQPVAAMMSNLAMCPSFLSTAPAGAPLHALGYAFFHN